MSVKENLDALIAIKRDNLERVNDRLRSERDHARAITEADDDVAGQVGKLIRRAETMRDLLHERHTLLATIESLEMLLRLGELPLGRKSLG